MPPARSSGGRRARAQPDVLGRAAAAAHAAEQQREAAGDQLAARLRDRRERDARVPAEVGAVEADHRDVLGHAHAERLEQVDQLHGEQVVRGDERRQPVVAADDLAEVPASQASASSSSGSRP